MATFSRATAIGCGWRRPVAGALYRGRRAWPAVMMMSLILAPAASAMAAGSWIAEQSLPNLSQRGRVYHSDPLTPRATTPLAGEAITRVHWRYGWQPAAGPDLVARLCAAGRCVDARGGQGQSDHFAGLAVDTAFRLEWGMRGDGPIRPVRRGDGLQLVVDFE